MVRCSARLIGAAIAAGSLAAACAPLPKVELNAYTVAYSDTQAITNGVLDIVAPYERVVIRYAAGTRTVSIPVPTTPARPAGTVDPSLLANPQDAPAAAPKPPAAKTTTVVFERTCRNGYTGPDPYCFEYRAGYADIGDPPLVHAYRNLSDVIARFNALLVAYANGVDARLLAQDLNNLSASVGALANLAPISSIGGAVGLASRFNGIVAKLLPIADVVGPVVDSARLRVFLLENYQTVDDAMALLQASSPALYSNVAVGTNLFRLTARGSGEALKERRRAIRRLIANWTVLIDHDRRLLRELTIAIEHPDGLETRLRNLNETTVAVRIDTSSIKKEIANLGTPVLPP
jgi:hypothetical protein